MSPNRTSEIRSMGSRRRSRGLVWVSCRIVNLQVPSRPKHGCVATCAQAGCRLRARRRLTRIPGLSPLSKGFRSRKGSYAVHDVKPQGVFLGDPCEAPLRKLQNVHSTIHAQHLDASRMTGATVAFAW